MGYSGSYSSEFLNFDNQFFKILLQESWEKISEIEYKAEGKDVYVTSQDMALLKDEEFKKYVELYAKDLTQFEMNFVTAWDKLSNVNM